jgi:DNA-binding NtrC family response regulator
MPSRNLLWILNTVSLPAQSECGEILEDFRITRVPGLADAREPIRSGQFSSVLISGTAPDADPAEVLEIIHRMDPLLPVVFWDPDMRASDAVRLIRSGAHACVGYRDTLTTLRDCLETAVEEGRRLRKVHDRAGAGAASWRALLVGESRAMQTVAETIQLIGPRRCTVLITGETGTGKEMAARALHMASPRANQPMVAINCSALPEHLLEAELFGHVRGAFTGAINTRVGRFEQAHKGTIFLDEIADMPLPLQAKLLRVLQEREIQRLGSCESIKVDVRVIAASNVNLLERVRQGRFREDLYYRLNVVPLQMPPLRQRESDIGLLVLHFVRKVCLMEGIPVKRVLADTLAELTSAPWPGNVRQLENAVEMAVALSGQRDILLPADFGLSAKTCFANVPIQFPAPAAHPLSGHADFEMAVSQFERSMLESALSKTMGNKTAAAQLLGMKRTTLIMKLRSLENSRALRAG